MTNTSEQITATPQVLSMPVPAPIGHGVGIIGIIERYLRDPSIDVVKLEGMVALQERLLRWEAETAWNTAMSEAQEEMRAVSKDSANLQTRSRYASYAAIDAALRPIYSKHGFALSFNAEDGRSESSVKIVCEVSKGGHSKRYQIDMPADGKGARGNDVMTKTHATGSAVKYGMRYLATMIFNIATADDDDGNAAGRSGDGFRRPPQPGPNVLRDREPPHDPETGEILPRSTGMTDDEAAPSTSSGLQPREKISVSEETMEWDKRLAEAAELGISVLSLTWTQVPAHLKPALAAAKDRRHKVRAKEIDAARVMAEQASGSG